MRRLLEASLEEVGGLEENGGEGTGAEASYEVECCLMVSTTSVNEAELDIPFFEPAEALPFCEPPLDIAGSRWEYQAMLAAFV